MNRMCFIIAPIGEPASSTRRRSDQVLKFVIRPALEGLGYDAVRADEISDPGVITNQVIRHLIDAPLVIADLSERNPNVFYELALRHVTRKPLIQLIQRGETIPFDVAGMRTIVVDHRDLDSVDEAQAEIRRQVKTSEENSDDLDTPVSFALELKQLDASEYPEDRSLGDLKSQLAEIRGALAGIERVLADPKKLLPPRYLRSASGLSEGDRLIYVAIQDLLDKIANSKAWWKESADYFEVQQALDQIRGFLHYAQDAEETG